MATTTVDLDTELSAVNSILGSIGQSPITSLGLPDSGTGDTINFQNPEIAFIYNILTEVNKDVQNEGWHFNTEYHITKTLDEAGEISVPGDALRYDFFSEGIDKTFDVVNRNGKLYDLVDHSSTFDSGTYYLDIVRLYPFTDLPNAFQRYITYRAASRAAAQLVSNPQLVQLLQTQEAQARAICLEYECNQGSHSFFGSPHDTNYRNYQPYHALKR
tara:strand:+ start:241 stop:888 length:648 start_codon:yes stop_codon:yes gene_type:complete